VLFVTFYRYNGKNKGNALLLVTCDGFFMPQFHAYLRQVCLLHQHVYPRTQHPLSVDRQQSIFAVYGGIEPQSPPLRGGHTKSFVHCT